MNNVCLMEPLPGLLSACTGLEVEEYDPIGYDPHQIVTTDESSYSCSQWCDILNPTTAETLAW